MPGKGGCDWKVHERTCPAVEEFSCKPLVFGLGWVGLWMGGGGGDNDGGVRLLIILEKKDGSPCRLPSACLSWR